MTIRSRDGFTLVELLVVIAIVGILLGLLLPNLAAVQQTAKAGAQAAIMQSFGRGFMDFSTLDSQGRLSSGAYDHMRDGDITKVGWVADLVNGKYANPGKSLDPVNRHKVSAAFQTACSGGQDSENLGNGNIDGDAFNSVRWCTNITRRPSDNAVVVTPWQVVGSGYFGTSQTVWDDGYNTNFATTWHFSRGDNVAAVGQGYDCYNGNTSDPLACPLDGDGPLSTAHLGDPSLLTSTDKIALLGPARSRGEWGVDGGDFRMDLPLATVTAGQINAFIDPTGRKRIVKSGDFTLKSFTDGPNADVVDTYTRGLVPAAYRVPPPFAAHRVHEISDIAPHVKAKRIKNAAHPSGVMAGGYANILFADGSTRRVNDNSGYGGANKGDGWIGPYHFLGKQEDIDSAGWVRNFRLDAEAFSEVRDDIYLGLLRARLAPGGGSSE
jgi:prepilin-type N-terminal cleavage/methylation domain-containing protein/prepilin-type processing-associated H-X9-DG protein